MTGIAKSNFVSINWEANIFHRKTRNESILDVIVKTITVASHAVSFRDKKNNKQSTFYLQKYNFRHNFFHIVLAWNKKLGVFLAFNLKILIDCNTYRNIKQLEFLGGHTHNLALYKLMKSQQAAFSVSLWVTYVSLLVGWS